MHAWFAYAPEIVAFLVVAISVVIASEAGG
jgi:hypothetical protein